MTQVPSYSPLLIFILGVLVQVRARPESLTVLIVLDGFRHDYLDGYSAPHIQKLVSEGVLVPDVTPIFPASKWPNLASLITGHYPDAHNVLDTEVYDPIRNVTLHKNETEFWNSTLRLKTLWDLHDNANGRRVTEVLGLPEQSLIFPKSHDKSEEILRNILNPRFTGNGSTPSQDTNNSILTKVNATDLLNYNKNWFNELKESVERCLRKCNATEDSKSFVTIFIDQPGIHAQVYGPDTVAAVIKEVDDFVGEVRAQISHLGLADLTNLLLVSTPGYADVRLEDLIKLELFLPPGADVHVVGESPVANLHFNLDRLMKQDPETAAEMMLYTYVPLTEAAKRDKQFDVYFKPVNMPSSYHYNGSAFAQPIVVVAKSGHAFVQSFKDRLQIIHDRKGFNRKTETNNIYGFNGYDPDLSLMHTLLVAQGPEFLQKVGTLPKNETHVVKMVDIFPLLCKVLDMSDACGQRDGDPRSLENILQGAAHPKSIVETAKRVIENVSKFVSTTKNLPIIISIAVALLVVIGAIVVICLARRRHKRMLQQAGFKYSQVRNNRRSDDKEFHDDFDDDRDDKRGLLNANDEENV